MALHARAREAIDRAGRAIDKALSGPAQTSGRDFSKAADEMDRGPQGLTARNSAGATGGAPAAPATGSRPRGPLTPNRDLLAGIARARIAGATGGSQTAGAATRSNVLARLYGIRAAAPGTGRALQPFTNATSGAPTILGR